MAGILVNSLRRGLTGICSRPLYVVMMVAVPLGCTLFFLSLLQPGLPMRVPAAVVDLDGSAMSRQMVRSLSAMELVDVREHLTDYGEAMAAVRQGRVYGFFLIPAGFGRDAVAGAKPTISFYSNLTYFVPGTFAFKGFKTLSVGTAGNILRTELTAAGVPSQMQAGLLQPVVIDSHGIGNPWSNYSYYLTPSFSLLMLALVVMLVTCHSITMEIKHATSVEWLSTAGGSMGVALAGKLLPQLAVFVAVGVCMMSLFFGYNHFPLNGGLGMLLVAVVLFVLASQAVGVLLSSLLPNPRLALSVTSLVGILTFSFGGISFPVESMYGAIAAFSWLVPSRYMYLIYVNTALNGYEVYYVRWLYAALIAFPLVAALFTRRLRKMCVDPVYIP